MRPRRLTLTLSTPRLRSGQAERRGNWADTGACLYVGMRLTPCKSPLNKGGRILPPARLRRTGGAFAGVQHTEPLQTVIKNACPFSLLYSPARVSRETKKYRVGTEAALKRLLRQFLPDPAEQFLLKHEDSDSLTY